MPQPCVASFVQPSEVLIAHRSRETSSHHPENLEGNLVALWYPPRSSLLSSDFLPSMRRPNDAARTVPWHGPQRIEASRRTRPGKARPDADCNVVMALRRSVARTQLQSPDARSMRAFQTVCGSYGDTRPRPPAVVRLMSPVQRFFSSNRTNNNSLALGAANSSLRTACPGSGRLLGSSNAGLFSTMLSRRTDRLANTMSIQKLNRAGPSVVRLTTPLPQAELHHSTPVASVVSLYCTAQYMAPVSWTQTVAQTVPRFAHLSLPRRPTGFFDVSTPTLHNTLLA
ncbi:hypothetical protein B0T14DRAFT_338654 [Immersiella caudata]|uniref:Uncharacterized protein n=1 Tax=Immersiella caudata TaxID=314043 RepID=A0AA39U693_9PEZI|nr:hypothetical protein B0T14DRAFT_338654 [Immersiella caudata]